MTDAELLTVLRTRCRLHASVYGGHWREYLTDAWLGWVDASRRWDPKRGASLKTFSERRIRGAIIDALRSDRHLRASVGELPMEYTQKNAPRDDNAMRKRSFDYRGTVAKALSKMNGRERLVLRLVAEGWTQGEVAEVLGVSDRRVVQILSAGRGKA